AAVGLIACGAGSNHTENYLENRQQSQVSQQEEKQKAYRLYENPYFAGDAAYDRITSLWYDEVDHSWHKNRLTEIVVDKDGDGKTDEMIVFYRKYPDVSMSANRIGIYEGNWASDMSGKKKEYIPLPGDLPTSKDYRDAAMKVLEEKGYPSDMIKGFEFPS
ncbi:MAG: hypothetical protein HY518_04035, partial [Candidatus Aenigmarchaeota archaeon]|nr:hypothetical protein [Candidatus Aenigmarchaeota archaeon]